MPNTYDKYDLTMPPAQLHERISFLREVEAWCLDHGFLKGAAEWLPWGQKRITELNEIKQGKR